MHDRRYRCAEPGAYMEGAVGDAVFRTVPRPCRDARLDAMHVLRRIRAKRCRYAHDRQSAVLRPCHAHRRAYRLEASCDAGSAARRLVRGNLPHDGRIDPHPSGLVFFEHGHPSGRLHPRRHRRGARRRHVDRSLHQARPEALHSLRLSLACSGIVRRTRLELRARHHDACRRHAHARPFAPLPPARRAHRHRNPAGAETRLRRRADFDGAHHRRRARRIRLRPRRRPRLSPRPARAAGRPRTYGPISSASSPSASSSSGGRS